ncbi:MAG: hypothetical protein FWH35_09305, partial [Treponema sp.]|nr:hypothetical protein [Treponema sp.]
MLIRIRTDINAAPSRKSWASNWVIIRDIGLDLALLKNDTAEMVIIEFTKKYDIISKMVNFVSGIRT